MIPSSSNETLAASMSGGSSPNPGKESPTFTEPNKSGRRTSVEDCVVSRLPEFEVIFQRNDSDNPKNWSKAYRIWTIVSVSFSAWVVVLYSTSYTGSIPGLKAEFHTTTTTTTLGMTTYLIGLAIGSIFVAPISEIFGRRIVYLSCLCIWSAFIIPSALAQSINTILAVRFFGALFGAALISNGPGTVVDVSKPEQMAFGMSLFSLGPFNGPVLGPLIGGFIFEYMGWRWTNWIVLILAGGAFGMMLTVKETYTPTILKRKAAQMRKESGDSQWWCQYDNQVSTSQVVKKNLSRPFVLFFTEPIVWFINVWNALIYGILYLCFVAYPVVFTHHRGWGPGFSGMAYLGIGIGIVLAIVAEPLIRKFINSQPRDPITGKPKPEAAAVIMAVGSILTPLGQLGFAWTCLPNTIHWIVPICFGIPFGAGNTLSFIYSSNYLAGAYGIYAASALASNAVIRSIFGATLPIAGAKMYETMTPQWAGTLCGLLAIAMMPVPFVFWRYGAKIRGKSRTIRQLREEQERLDAKMAADQAKAAEFSSSEGQLVEVYVEKL